MRTFLLLAFLCCAFFSPAQPALTWSDPLYSTLSGVKLIGVKGSEAYVAVLNESVDIYETGTLKLKSSRYMTSSDSLLKAQHVVLLGGKLLALCFDENRKDATRKLCTWRPGERTTLAHSSVKPEEKRLVRLELIFSQDSTRLLIAETWAKRTEEDFLVRFIALDQNGNVSSTGEELLPAPKVFEKHAGAQLVICNNGNICLLKKLGERGFMREKDAQHTLILYKGASRSELPVRMLTHEHLSKLALCADAQNNVTVTGFGLTMIKRVLKGNYITSVFHMRLGPDLEVRNWGSLQPLPEPGNTQPAMDQRYAEAYLPRFLQATADGGLVAVYEKYWEKKHEYENVDDRDSSRRETVYEFERQFLDLAVLCFDAEGKLRWTQFIAKKQIVRSGLVSTVYGNGFFALGSSSAYGNNDERFVSFTCLPGNEAVTLFFNDPADLDSRPPSEIVRWATAHDNAASPVMVQIGKDGSVTRTALSDEPKRFSCPAEALPATGGTLIVPGTWGTHVHLGRLDLNGLED